MATMTDSDTQQVEKDTSAEDRAASNEHHEDIPPPSIDGDTQPEYPAIFVLKTDHIATRATFDKQKQAVKDIFRRLPALSRDFADDYLDEIDLAAKEYELAGYSAKTLTQGLSTMGEGEKKDLSPMLLSFLHLSDMLFAPLETDDFEEMPELTHPDVSYSIDDDEEMPEDSD